MNLHVRRTTHNACLVLLLIFLFLLFGKLYNSFSNIISTRTSKAGPLTFHNAAQTNMNQIFYNRVGKSGSRSLNDIILSIAQPNNFTAKMSKEYERKRLNQSEEEAFVQEFQSYKEPFFYNRHLYFVDFTKYGYTQPIYINLVRDPLEQRLSHFYYLQENNFDAINNITGLTLEDCILKHHLFCTDPNLLNTLILYFCGHDEVLCSPENPKATLKQAMKNVDRHYWIVGVLDHFDETVEALELALPNYFRGASQAHAILKVHWKIYSTTSRKTLSNKAMEEFKSRLQPNYELYSFIRQRFFSDLSSLRNHKH